MYTYLLICWRKASAALRRACYAVAVLRTWYRGRSPRCCRLDENRAELQPIVESCWRRRLSVKPVRKRLSREYARRHFDERR